MQFALQEVKLAVKTENNRHECLGHRLLEGIMLWLYTQVVYKEFVYICR